MMAMDNKGGMNEIVIELKQIMDYVVHIINGGAMKIKLLAIAVFVAIGISLLVGCGGSTSADPTTTVLLYMEGTDLEAEDSQAKHNITEMLSASSSPNLTVVLTTGAADKAISTDDVKDWRTVRRYVMRDKKLVLVPNPVPNPGDKDMGDPLVLTDFIRWGQETYPADRYILVFWDHGGGALGGYGGITGDAYKGKPYYASNLTVNQLKKAVEDAVGNDSKKKFELIGFDACLMATLEVADAFKDLSKYLVASEDLEPGAGWDWKAFLDYVASNPSAGGEAIGIKIADSFYEKTQNDPYATLSVVDLSMVPTIKNALSSFALSQKSLIDTDDGVTAWFDLAIARSASLDFNSTNLNTKNTSEMVDLIDFADRTQVETSLKTDLSNAIKAAVKYKIQGSKRSTATGLSVMFPSVIVWNSNLVTGYQTNSYVQSYYDLVKKYSDFATSISIENLTITTPVITNPSASIKKLTASFDPLQYSYERGYVAICDYSDPSNPTYYGMQPIEKSAGPVSRNVLEYEWTDNKWITLNGALASLIAEKQSDGSEIYQIPVGIGSKTVPTQFGTLYISYIKETKKFEELGFQGYSSINQAYPRSKIEAGKFVYPLELQMQAGEPIGTWVYNLTRNFEVPTTGIAIKEEAPNKTLTVNFILYDLRWKPYMSIGVDVNFQ